MHGSYTHSLPHQISDLAIAVTVTCRFLDVKCFCTGIRFFLALHACRHHASVSNRLLASIYYRPQQYLHIIDQAFLYHVSDYFRTLLFLSLGNVYCLWMLVPSPRSILRMHACEEWVWVTRLSGCNVLMLYRISK